MEMPGRILREHREVEANLGQRYAVDANGYAADSLN